MRSAIVLSTCIVAIAAIPTASADTEESEPSCGIDLRAADELRGGDAGCNVPVVGRVVVVAGRGLYRDCDPDGPNIVIMVGFDNEVSC